jgi:predicted DNA-binding protein (UPF0251 family)
MACIHFKMSYTPCEHIFLSFAEYEVTRLMDYQGLALNMVRDLASNTLSTPKDLR